MNIKNALSKLDELAKAPYAQYRSAYEIVQQVLLALGKNNTPQGTVYAIDLISQIGAIENRISRLEKDAFADKQPASEADRECNPEKVKEARTPVDPSAFICINRKVAENWVKDVGYAGVIRWNSEDELYVAIRRSLKEGGVK